MSYKLTKKQMEKISFFLDEEDIEDFQIFEDGRFSLKFSINSKNPKKEFVIETIKSVINEHEIKQIRKKQRKTKE